MYSLAGIAEALPLPDAAAGCALRQLAAGPSFVPPSAPVSGLGRKAAPPCRQRNMFNCGSCSIVGCYR